MPIHWSTRYSKSASQASASAIREILKLTQQPGIISFAGGLPAPELLPVAELRAAAQRVLDAEGPRALQYSTTEGYPPLRRFVAERETRRGVPVAEDNVLIISGAQQGLDLVSKVLLNTGDKVVIERPTFLGAIQAFSSYRAAYVGVEVDNEGIITDDLGAVLDERVKFMYIQPNFQNPAGTTLSLARRQALLTLSHHHSIPIIEDDSYGELRFEGEFPPTLLAVDFQMQPPAGHGDALAEAHVIRFVSFSKVLAPGLRLAALIAPAEVVRRLVIAKQGADLHTGTFIQMLAYETVREGLLDAHVPRMRQVYHQRRDAMLSAMDRYLPDGVGWTLPQGGFFIWVTLPETLDAADMLQRAIREGVAYVPGVAFYADDGHAPQKNTLRLNYSYSAPETIDEGMRRLGRVMAEYL